MGAMKKMFKALNLLIKDCKIEYITYFILMFFSVLFMLLSTYATKVLVDILEAQGRLNLSFNKEILLTDLNDIDVLERLFINSFGGIKFLSTNLYMFAVIILGFAIISGLISLIRFFQRSDFMARMSKNMQQLLFYHIERLPFSTIKSLNKGDIIQTCTRDEDVLKRFFGFNISLIVYTFFIVTISFTILCITSYKIALISMCLMPFMFVYSFFIIKDVRKRYRITDDSESLMTGKIEENLASIRLVKAFNNEAYEVNDFNKYINDYKGKYLSWRRLSAFFFASSDIFVFSQIALTTIFGFYLIFTKQISVGTLVISFSFVSMMVWPIRDVATVLSNLAQAIASLDRINILLDYPLEDIDSGEVIDIKGNIEFNNVSFNYEDSNIDTLKNISFKINKGQTIAIMGKTGSGKSTLVYLLTRLFDYSSGSITIDGVELKDIQKNCLRNNISIVLQEPFLFSKTIKENITITNKDTDFEEVRSVTRISHIDDSINKFKDGYDTPVGEKGTTLSGGQKQRVAIARALLKKTPILIFDDSLSAVDTETDFQIRKSLKEYEKEATTLIITHRISTAKDADLIIVLDEGKIIESGNHNELISKDGLYKKIYDIQTKMV